MTLWSELRGVIAVGLVVVAIVALFRYLPDYGDDAAFEAQFNTTTTITAGSAAPVVATVAPVVPKDLCALADEFVAGVSSELFVYPGKQHQLAELFYIEAYDASEGPVRAEFAAARDYYIDYNDIAEPDDYNPLTIISGNNAARFKQLSTREPNGVAVTIANVGFLCGTVIPGPPLLSAEEFEEFEDQVEDDE